MTEDNRRQPASLPKGEAATRAAPTLALAGLFLLALALRLFRLGTVPLGGHGDVAWIGINALDWLRSGVWPYYIYELYAPEPVIVYAAGLSIALFGPGFFASRLPTVLASALVVPVGHLAAYWLGKGDRDEGTTTPRTMWIFALAYAVSFYPIILSKTGQRSQLFPLEVTVLTMLFAYAWQSGSLWAFAGAAGALALANYTYIPARLLPVVLILWAGHGFLTDRERFKKRLLPFLGMGLLSALLVAPQLITYLRTPEAFFARSNQAAGRFIFQSGLSGAGLWGTLGLKALGELKIMLLPWHGPYSEMGRPLLELPLAIGLIAAVVAAFFRRKDRALWWPLLGLPVMLVTDFLSGTELEPHGLRLIGALPFAFLLAARGVALLWGWAEARLARRAITGRATTRRAATRAAPTVLALIVALLVAVPGLVEFGLYHWQYIPAARADPDTAERLEASDVFLVDLILGKAPPDRPVLLAMEDFSRANVVYLLSGEYPVRHSAVGAQGNHAGLPLPDGPVTVARAANPLRPRHDGLPPIDDPRNWVLLYEGQMALIPPLTAEAAQAIQDALAGDEPFATASDWIGQEQAYLYAVTLPPHPFGAGAAVENPVGASLGGEIELVGYTVDSHHLAPGETFWITLYWRALAGASEDYETFVQLWDASGQPLAQIHRWTFDGVYRTRLWRDDELTPQRFGLDVPADLPPGAYTIITGLYHVLQNEPLGMLGESGEVIAPHATLRGFKVPIPPALVTQPPPPEPVTFGGQIEMAGLAVTREGQALRLRVDWQALAAPGAAHTLFVHVVGADEAIIAQLDGQPRGGTYPTLIWDAGEVVPDDYVIPLPDDLAPGTYTVYIGWYTLPDATRLPALVGGEAAPGDRVPVFSFEVP